MTNKLIEAMARALCWSEGEPANCAHYYTESAKAARKAISEAGYAVVPQDRVTSAGTASTPCDQIRGELRVYCCCPDCVEPGVGPTTTEES